MRRWIAVAWHATFFVLAAVLYFLFVLPRWWELTGVWTPSLGTPMRIVTGVLIGLSALPVVFTLLRTRKPEFGTPQLALSLRVWSIVLHVLAGVLIVGAAVAEIWLDLNNVGQWLFGIYGAAAALAVLGALGFYLAFEAELPPPPPKPIKLKSETGRRGRRRGKDADEDADAETDETTDDASDTSDADEPATTESDADSEADDSEPAGEPQPVAETATADEETPSDETAASETTADADAVSDAKTESATESEAEPEGKLRNRRPGGKATSRFRRRGGGGVAVDE